MNVQNNADVSLCNRCKSVNRANSFCSTCGTNIKHDTFSTNIIRARSLPLGIKDSDKEDSFNYIGQVNVSSHIKIDDICNIISYQDYLFDTSDKPLAIADKKTGRFMTANKKFEELTGYSKKNSTRRLLPDLISELNDENNGYDMNTIPGKNEFLIYARDKTIAVKITQLSDEMQNSSLLVNMEHIVVSRPKKNKTVTKSLFLIARIAEEINRSLDIKVILNNTLDKVMAVTGSDVALIMFVNENNILVPITSRGLTEQLIENLKNCTIETTTGSRAKALSLGKTVEANLKETTTSLTGALILKENLLSILTVPLKSKDEIIGIMSLGRRRQEGYAGEDLELLDAIGNHVAIAIKNSRLYEQIKAQLKELGEKNKKLHELEETKERLTRMIIHDLKSPLTGIMAYAEYMQSDETVKKGNLFKMVQTIYASSQDILRMVMNLLEISKMKEEKLTLKPFQVSPNEIVSKILEEMQIKLLKKNIKIIKTIPDTLPDIKVDKDIFYRIITNLLDNAIKYSNTNGKIKIEIRRYKDENNIICCITDEGKGIPQEYREKIFESFFKLDEEHSEITTSTGIGLTFCKLAVEAQGGKMWYEENVPRGSKFYFIIPMDGSEGRVIN